MVDGNNLDCGNMDLESCQMDEVRDLTFSFATSPACWSWSSATAHVIEYVGDIIGRSVFGSYSFGASHRWIVFLSS